PGLLQLLPRRGAGSGPVRHAGRLRCAHGGGRGGGGGGGGAGRLATRGGLGDDGAACRRDDHGRRRGEREQGRDGGDAEPADARHGRAAGGGGQPRPCGERVVGGAHNAGGVQRRWVAGDDERHAGGEQGEPGRGPGGRRPGER